MATDQGAAAADVVTRLDHLGVRLDKDRADELLGELVERGLAHREGDTSGDGRYSPSPQGVTHISDLETHVLVRTELADLERLRTELLGVVGHQLRTPLTAIRTSVSLLQDPDVRPNPAETGVLLARIAKSAERMQQLVADVLDIARFRSGDVRLQLRLVDAAALAARAAMGIRPLMTQKRQHLAVRIEARPLVYGDPHRLRQVLMKLLSNANRFAPPGADIELRLHGDAEQVVWSVSDCGPGISAENLPRLFERFFMSESAAAGQPGAGLGLPIALAIARAHGGTINVETTPGAGSTFSLRLPMRHPEMPEQ